MKKILIFLLILLSINLVSASELIITSGTTVLGGTLEYDNIFIGSGATINVNSTFGYINFTATGNITILGTINLDGNGSAGGSGGGGVCNSGGTGQGIGGAQGGQPCDTNAGGGGGAGHHNTGGAGQTKGISAGGTGGSSYGNSTNITLYLGSGGGGGASDSVGIGGSAGGAGGGGIIIKGQYVRIGGTINARGNNGIATNNDGGAGGGGSGGTIAILGNDVDISSATLRVTGGNGGTTTGNGGQGGGGSGGVIKVFYQETFSSSGVTTSISGGSGASSGGTGAYTTQQQELGVLEVELISPTDMTSTNEDYIIFNFTTDTHSSGYNFTNATLIINYENGTLFNQTTNIITGNTTNSTTFNITGFTYGDYSWNVYVCTNEVICAYAINNYTLLWRPFTIINTSFTSEVLETSNQNYTIEIETLPEILSVNAKIYYNGTAYSANAVCNAPNCTISANIDVPLVSSASSENKSFFWEITVFDGSSSISFNTTEQQQNVSRIFMQSCGGSVTTQAYNFTAYQESNLTRINPYSFEGTFNYWLGTGSVYRNQSFNNNSISERTICISPSDENFMVNADINYNEPNNGTTYVERNYYIRNGTANNVSNDINLYLLESEDATTFILKVQDNTVQPVSDALILIQRYYPGEGVYRTVQIAKTDSNGATVGFYKAETVTYKHQIIKAGQLLLDTGEGGVVVGESVPFTLIFTVGESLSSPWEILEDNPNILTSLSYNKTNELVTFTYVDLLGTNNFGRLYVYQESLINGTITTICDNSLTGFSSATITCNMSGFSGTFIAEGYVTNTSTLAKIITFIVTNALELFDETGAFLGWIILLTVAMAGLWNPSVGIILVNATMIFLGFTGLLIFSPTTYFAIMGVSIVLLILFKT